jgi:hypothetical protein
MRSESLFYFQINPLQTKKRTNVLDLLHGAVGFQCLGNLLSCFWTELDRVRRKTAETGENAKVSKMKSILSTTSDDKNEHVQVTVQPVNLNQQSKARTHPKCI